MRWYESPEYTPTYNFTNNMVGKMNPQLFLAIVIPIDPCVYMWFSHSYSLILQKKNIYFLYFVVAGIIFYSVHPEWFPICRSAIYFTYFIYFLSCANVYV